MCWQFKKQSGCLAKSSEPKGLRFLANRSGEQRAFGRGRVSDLPAVRGLGPAAALRFRWASLDQTYDEGRGKLFLCAPFTCPKRPMRVRR